MDGQCGADAPVLAGVCGGIGVDPAHRRPVGARLVAPGGLVRGGLARRERAGLVRQSGDAYGAIRAGRLVRFGGRLRRLCPPCLPQRPRSSRRRWLSGVGSGRTALRRRQSSGGTALGRCGAGQVTPQHPLAARLGRMGLDRREFGRCARADARGTAQPQHAVGQFPGATGAGAEDTVVETLRQVLKDSLDLSRNSSQLS